MSEHYATMQQMTKVDESQRDLEQKNPGFVVSQIQYEDFKITKFQREMEQNRMSEVDKAVENKIQYNLEMDVIEVLNFLDSEEDTLKIDEEAFNGLANALECLGVREDDIKYLGAKMTASEDLQKTDIKFIQ